MTVLGRTNTAVSVSKWRRSLSVGSVAATGAILSPIAAAAVYVSVVSAPGTAGFLGAGLALVALAIAVIDGRSFIIPDRLNATGGGLALMYAAVQEPEAMLSAVTLAALRGLALALIFFAIRYGYARLRGRQGLGLGDVKLAFVAGAWLDVFMVSIAIQVAVFGALSAYLVRHLLRRQPLSASSRMPFGLFFAPAIWISWLLEVRWLASF